MKRKHDEEKEDVKKKQSKKDSSQSSESDSNSSDEKSKDKTVNAPTKEKRSTDHRGSSKDRKSKNDAEKDSDNKKKKKKDKSPSPKGSDEDGEREKEEFVGHGNRYWGGEPKDVPIRKNSDKYWNKFGRDDHVIGSRYYGGADRHRGDRRQRQDGSRGRRGDSREGSRERQGDSRRRRSKDRKDDEKKKEANPVPPKKAFDPISSKTGGAYIPPAKLKMMQASITDKSSSEYQRIAWEALKKSIHGLINKINTSNIAQIIKQLFKENIVRGRGLLCRSLIQAQALSPTFTNVYAALVALINSRFPNIGELLLRRLVLQFRRGYKRNDKTICISATAFVAHLVNQKVVHEILALEILTLLVENPTDDSVVVAISFLKECGMKLTEVSNKGVDAIFEMLRHILSEGKLDKRVQYMIEVMFQIRKDKFKDHEAVIEGLDLVEEADQFTHLMMLEDATEGEEILNVFKFDPEYTENEEKYKALSKEMLGESDESGSDSDGESGSDDEDESGGENEDDEEKKQLIIDNTETNLIALRRTIYLTLYSSLDFEECAHKLMKMELKPGQEEELCHMILDCCCEMRTYEKFYGLLAQRFCLINKSYIPPFQKMFKDSYDTVYRLKANQLRNVSKFFAHMLFTDAFSWEVLECIKLNEDDTTSSGRIFIRTLFQELSEYMGLEKLNTRVKDTTLQEAFSGLFPRDNPKNTRFAINFFTAIGLGGLTDELREHLKSQMKTAVAAAQLEDLASSEDEEDSSSDSSSSSSSSSDSSSSSSSSSDSESNSSSEDEKSHKKNKRTDVRKNAKNRKGQTAVSEKKRKKKTSESPPKNNRSKKRSTPEKNNRSKRESSPLRKDRPRKDSPPVRTDKYRRESPDRKDKLRRVSPPVRKDRARKESPVRKDWSRKESPPLRRESPARKDRTRRESPIRNERSRKESPVRKDRSRKESPVRKDRSRKESPVRKDRSRKESPVRKDRSRKESPPSKRERKRNMS